MPGDCSLLIVSDLHLSEGRDPLSGRVSRNEDFFFDDDFAEFLDHHTHSPGEWKLVINGDFIDFLQITSQPPSPSSGILADTVYGLKAGAEESVWKLKRVAQGHRRVFQALGAFAVDNSVAIISGNHDVEFYFPQVQEAFLKELEACVPEGQQEKIRGHVEFLPWFYFDGILYAEHGHQYDSFNSFTYVLDPRLPRSTSVKDSEQEHIDLPIGSLFVRYLFNRVEASTPFADNVKPATRFIGWFLSHHPLRAIGFLLKEGVEMFRRVRAKWKWVPESAFTERRATHNSALRSLAATISERYPSKGIDWENVLGELYRLGEPSLMRGPGPKSWKLLRSVIGPFRTPFLLLVASSVMLCGLLFLAGPLLRPIFPSLLLDYLGSVTKLAEPWWPLFAESVRLLFLLELVLLALWSLSRYRVRTRNHAWMVLRQRAERIQRLMNVKYVVMGHTHEVDLFDFGPDQHYFNTGTWTKVFGEKERVLREEKEFTFVRVTGRGQKRQARLMKWEGRSKAARLAYIFDRPREM